jgi:hypothetical protein
MNAQEVFLLRQQARDAQAARDARLVELHRVAAAALAGADAPSVKRAALAQVARWEAAHLCSPHYIALWQKILALPAADARSAMLIPDGEGPALRQNTPFGFLMRV